MNTGRGGAGLPARVAGSFRDPSGVLYRNDSGQLLRQINRGYAEDFECLKASGLLDELIGDGLLTPHDEMPLDARWSDDAAAVLKAEAVPFFSYPYEWCFSQYRDAALLTLDIQERALNRGMILKDASAFNVTFPGSRPVFVDLLSFERYEPGRPWIAYGQFCRHFLAPVALMAYRDVRLGALLRVHIDGVPLDLAARLLPGRSWLRLGLALHLHLHARTEAKPSDGGNEVRATRKVSERGLRGIVSNLRGTIERLTPAQCESHWSEYTESKPYSSAADRAKAEIVENWLEAVKPGTVWDLGANTGEYSELARETGADVLALEQDAACVEAMYNRWKGQAGITPLWMDLANPSPGLGWAHEERDAFAARGPADCLLALALVHHVCIGNNVPLQRLAEFLGRIGKHLIIEFVPKEDPMVQKLLGSREDIFSDYTQATFEAAFDDTFETEAREPVRDSMRVLYRMRRRESR